MTFDPLTRTTWPEALTRQQCAAIWNVKERTFDQMRKHGLLPHPLHATPLRWAKADVIRWFDDPRSRRGLRLAS